MENDNPEYLVHELFCRRFWAEHPLGRPIAGTPQTVESFHGDVIRDYFSRIYTPSNILITAAGNLQHESLLDLARDEFEHKPASPPLPACEPPASSGYTQFENKDSLEQVHVCLGAPAYPVGHELRYACYVLNTLLGGGMSSRLFQNIREKRGLAYSVYSDLNLYRDSGCLLVSAGTSADSAAEVIRLSLDEFRLLKNQLVPEEELRRTKDQLKGSLMLSLESTGARMSNLARQQLYFGRFYELDEILSSIEAVTVEELQQIAADFFQPDKLALTVLGNLNGLTITDLDC
jgi:predicted Zn-dependent peptidase